MHNHLFTAWCSGYMYCNYLTLHYSALCVLTSWHVTHEAHVCLHQSRLCCIPWYSYSDEMEAASIVCRNCNSEIYRLISTCMRPIQYDSYELCHHLWRRYTVQGYSSSKGFWNKNLLRNCIEIVSGHKEYQH